MGTETLTETIGAKARRSRKEEEGGGKRCRRESEGDTPKGRARSYVEQREDPRSVGRGRHLELPCIQHLLPRGSGGVHEILSLVSVSTHPRRHQKVVKQPQDPCSNTGVGHSKLDLTNFSFSCVERVGCRQNSNGPGSQVSPAPRHGGVFCGFIQGTVREGA